MLVCPFTKAATSERTIGRLSLYRRLLNALLAEGRQSVYSHELAAMAGGTAAQVRRDVMALGSAGNPRSGYGCAELVASIAQFLDDREGQRVALVGIGNLGRAIMAFFGGRRPKLAIVAAFDRDPYKVGRVIHGCRCYPMDQLPDVMKQQRISVGIITVNADGAQDVADKLVHAGAHGLLNFAPAILRVPPGVYVEDSDMTVALEKVAYFARCASKEKQ